jgi:hypothetical protein
VVTYTLYSVTWAATDTIMREKSYVFMFCSTPMDSRLSWNAEEVTWLNIKKNTIKVSQ